MGAQGARVAVDVGSVRVGIAACGSDARVAVPVATLPRDSRGDSDLARVAAEVADRAAVEVIVGLPRTLRGGDGPAATTAREYAAALGARIAPVPVRLVDERFTTVVAERQLRDSGRRGGAKNRRGVIDQAAAVALLQSVLDGLHGEVGR